MYGGMRIIVVGAVMVAVGLVLYYVIQPGPAPDDASLVLKNTGTFVGLMGIGVLVAGVLLHLIRYNQPPAGNDPGP